MSKRHDSPGLEEPSNTFGLSRGVLVLIAIALGVFWRLRNVGSAFLFGDEFHSLRLAVHGYAEIVSTYGEKGSGLMLPLVQRLLGDWIGYSHWTVRLPAWLPGVLLVVAFYPIARRRLGGNAAAIGCVLTATSSFLVFYSHFGRSYALVAVLSLALVCLVQRIVDEGRASLGTLALFALVAAILPYTHMIAVGLVVPVSGAAVAVLGVRPETRRLALDLLASLAIGGLICLVLYYPAWDSYLQFFEHKSGRSYFGSFDIWDVALVVAGSRLGGMLLVCVSLAAIFRLVVCRKWQALPVVSACLGPVIVLLVARPYGDAYAWARYLIPALPVIFLVTGWALTDIARAMFRSRKVADTSALAAGIVLALCFVLPGPLGPWALADGPFASCYMGMVRLPAFDTPWPEMPKIYRQLAERDADLRVLELPGLFTRSRHLYRNYHAVHGKEIWLAFPEEEMGVVPSVHVDGPYVYLSDPDWLERADPDLLIVHRSPQDELRRYWHFVYQQSGGQVTDAGLAALMERHSRYFVQPKQIGTQILRDLQAKLGPPTYRDDMVSAWWLH